MIDTRTVRRQEIEIHLPNTYPYTYDVISDGSIPAAGMTVCIRHPHVRVLSCGEKVCKTSAAIMYQRRRDSVCSKLHTRPRNAAPYRALGGDRKESGRTGIAEKTQQWS